MIHFVYILIISIISFSLVSKWNLPKVDKKNSYCEQSLDQNKQESKKALLNENVKKEVISRPEVKVYNLEKDIEAETSQPEQTLPVGFYDVCEVRDKKCILESEDYSVDKLKIKIHDLNVDLQVAAIDMKIKEYKKQVGISEDRVCTGDTSIDPTCFEDFAELDSLYNHKRYLEKKHISTYPNCYTDICFIKKNDFNLEKL